MDLVQTMIDVYQYVRKIKLAKVFVKAKERQQQELLSGKPSVDLTAEDHTGLITLINQEEKIMGEDDAVSDEVITPLGAGLSDKKTKSVACPNLQPSNKEDRFHEAIIYDLYKIKFQKVKNKLLEKEREALDNLETDETIEIKPADKDGNIVNLDKKDYMNEANRQLAEKECYMILKSNPI
ncbi:hypothetical protein NDU88_003172 [Pleurodeles waltl]|uniref:Uncharacterized protein n=1 Tax=Pleurodeles waltl TaxID=8319 RepID=A0AAV7NFU7_PLEWA|nr:hypothetical protein NDU88_003172 [Pleurodeles waltl]